MGAELREHHMMVALKGLGFSSMNCIITLKNAGQMLLINLLFLCLLFGRHIKAKITNNPKDHEAALKA